MLQDAFSNWISSLRRAFSFRWLYVCISFKAEYHYAGGTGAWRTAVHPDWSFLRNWRKNRPKTSLQVKSVSLAIGLWRGKYWVLYEAESFAWDRIQVQFFPLNPSNTKQLQRSDTPVDRSWGAWIGIASVVPCFESTNSQIASLPVNLFKNPQQNRARWIAAQMPLHAFISW